MKKVLCENKCGFEDEFEPDEFGVSYFEAVGECPSCDAHTVYEDGTPTAREIWFILNEDCK